MANLLGVRFLNETLNLKNIIYKSVEVCFVNLMHDLGKKVRKIKGRVIKKERLRIDRKEISLTKVLILKAF